jgi:CBS domain containing-hemolysin-like protein
LPFYLWLALVAATGAALFFALANSALRSFSRARLEERLSARSRLGELRRLYEHHNDLLQMARALHILCLVAVTLLVQVWAIDRFGDGAAGWLVGGIAAGAACVTLAGVIPLAWAKYAAEGVLVVTLPVLHACRVVFSPIWRVLSPLDSLVRRLAGVPPDQRPLSHIEEEIRSVTSEGEREGRLSKRQKQMIENVIRFAQTDASQIMTPRTDIVSIESGTSAAEARALIAASGHSRIPVTSGNIDTIVGILYAKDLLERSCGAVGADLKVKDVCRPPLFVPETKELDELLREFQGDKVHMAIVLDEYGGTAGLVTIEDVVEEIVGEIVDEYEQEPPKPIRPIEPQSFEVEARVRIDELNRQLAVHLPEHEDYETVGGFVLTRLGYIPKAGEVLRADGLRITVLEADERRIMRLRIDLKQI